MKTVQTVDAEFVLNRLGSSLDSRFGMLQIITKHSAPRGRTFVRRQSDSVFIDEFHFHCDRFKTYPLTTCV